MLGANTLQAPSVSGGGAVAQCTAAYQRVSDAVNVGAEIKTVDNSSSRGWRVQSGEAGHGGGLARTWREGRGISVCMNMIQSASLGTDCTRCHSRTHPMHGPELTVVTQQGRDLAFKHLQAGAVDRHLGAKGLAQVTDVHSSRQPLRVDLKVTCVFMH